jgi:hypothetical protein
MAVTRPDSTPPWTQPHPGPNPTLDPTPPWTQPHPGLNPTLDSTPPWTQPHPGLNPTLDSTPPWTQPHPGLTPPWTHPTLDSTPPWTQPAPHPKRLWRAASQQEGPALLWLGQLRRDGPACASLGCVDRRESILSVCALRQGPGGPPALLHRARRGKGCQRRRAAAAAGPRFGVSGAGKLLWGKGDDGLGRVGGLTDGRGPAGGAAARGRGRGCGRRPRGSGSRRAPGGPGGCYAHMVPWGWAGAGRPGGARHGDGGCGQGSKDEADERPPARGAARGARGRSRGAGAIPGGVPKCQRGAERAPPRGRRGAAAAAAAAGAGGRGWDCRSKGKVRIGGRALQGVGPGPARAAKGRMQARAPPRGALGGGRRGRGAARGCRCRRRRRLRRGSRPAIRAPQGPAARTLHLRGQPAGGGKFSLAREVGDDAFPHRLLAQLVGLIGLEG